MSPRHPASPPGVLSELLQRHVDARTIAGAVALVDRDGVREVATVGVADLASGRPMTRDTVFRWASITKPVVAVAALTFVQDGAIGLDEPLDRWLPELGRLRVLRTPGADLTDTVPAARPPTLRDLLTSTCGWGFPSDAGGAWVAALHRWQTGLEITGPPPPQEWLAGLATLPLRHQPGTTYLYNTSYDVLGVLLARIARRPLPDVVHQRVSVPLGMADTGFAVRDDQRGRSSAAYRATPQGLELFDGVDGRWSSPPAFPSGAGGLVGTLDDWAAVAGELHGGGRVLSAESLRQLTTDQLQPGQGSEGQLFLAGQGWGFGGSVDPATGRYGWVGGTGTSAHVTPATGGTAILLTQTTVDSPVPPTFLHDFWDVAS